MAVTSIPPALAPLPPVLEDYARTYAAFRWDRAEGLDGLL
jgi:hypothetical protein